MFARLGRLTQGFTLLAVRCSMGTERVLTDLVRAGKRLDLAGWRAAQYFQKKFLVREPPSVVRDRNRVYVK